MLLQTADQNKIEEANCNPKTIMSALAQVEMSASLRDDRPSPGGSDGQRGLGHHECEGTQAGACAGKMSDARRFGNPDSD